MLTRLLPLAGAYRYTKDVIVAKLQAQEVIGASIDIRSVRKTVVCRRLANRPGVLSPPKAIST